jgi:hypothetical protein
VDIIAAAVAGEGIRTVAAITVDSKRAFYIRGISLANNESLTLNISGIQSIGTVNNPTIVINYPAKTFNVSRDHSGNTTIVDTTGGGATTVTDALLRIGNVVYKIHGFTMIGIPYDLNVYKIVNVGLYDVLTNSDYLDGRTGATGARGFTGTNGVVGATGLPVRGRRMVRQVHAGPQVRQAAISPPRVQSGVMARPVLTELREQLVHWGQRVTPGLKVG